jgi:hypothetical protein
VPGVFADACRRAWFFLIGGTRTGAGLGGGGSTAATIDRRVDSACTAVPAPDYAGAATAGAADAGEASLYACTMVA